MTRRKVAILTAGLTAVAATLIAILIAGRSPSNEKYEGMVVAVEFPTVRCHAHWTPPRRSSVTPRSWRSAMDIASCSASCTVLRSSTPQATECRPTRRRSGLTIPQTRSRLGWLAPVVGVRAIWGAFAEDFCTRCASCGPWSQPSEATRANLVYLLRPEADCSVSDEHPHGVATLPDERGSDQCPTSERVD
jgi:hypothetical protein